MVPKVRACLAQGADINWTNPDKNGITCLMRATFNENGPPRVAMVQVSFQFTQIYKNNVLNLLIFGRKFGFMGPFHGESDRTVIKRRQQQLGRMADFLPSVTFSVFDL